MFKAVSKPTFAAVSLLLLCALFQPPAEAQRSGPPPPKFTPTPTVNIPLPPVFTPPVFVPPVLPPPTTGGLPPVIVPTDVTNLNWMPPANSGGVHPALAGIKSVGEKSFPASSALSGPSSGILVRSEPGTEFSRPNVYVVDLQKGAVLLSVRRPSNVALIQTPLGEVSVAANGDAMVRFEDGLLRIDNLDGRGESVMVKFDGKLGSAKPLAIAPGFEIVAGDHTLGRSDVRPSDGIARRHSKVLEGGKIAVNTFSLQSLLESHSLIAGMNQSQSGTKERKILGDMSKMAAVLNYVNGTQGYVAEGKTH
jgi:hypothetical protein